MNRMRLGWQQRSERRGGRKRHRGSAKHHLGLQTVVVGVTLHVTPGNFDGRRVVGRGSCRLRGSPLRPLTNIEEPQKVGTWGSSYSLGKGRTVTPSELYSI